jgi:uncharacterized membrane protein
MPKSTLAGHPLHPMLIVAPAALLPFGAVMDAMHRATGDDSYADAAYYALIGGLAGGAAAAAAGIMDYLTIAPRTEVKQTANVHALLNSGALALTAVNLSMRRPARGVSGALSTAMLRPGGQHGGGSLLLSLLAAAGVLVSGWFGGRMVYEQGMRVRVHGVSPVAGAPELKAHGDKLMESVVHAAERVAPADGPVIENRPSM